MTSHSIAKMTKITDTAAHGAQGTGAAVTSSATLAPRLQPLGIENLPTAEELPPRASIELLPNELLSNIFGFLDTPKPSSSESTLHDEPHFELTKSKHVPLKAASCVSKRWRRTALPLLFKYAQFVVKEPKTQRQFLNKMIQPFFEFVSDNKLRNSIQSFTLIVHDKKVANNSGGEHKLGGFSAFWHSLFKAIDPKELLIVAPAEALGTLTSCQVYLEDAWNFDCPCHYLRLQIRPESPTPFSLEEGIPARKFSSAGPSQPIVGPVTETFPTEYDPQDLVRYENAQASEDYRPEASSSAPATLAGPEARELPPAKASGLFDIRPWTTLLLNEGSFIKAYATYEFWLRQPPSILPDLVGADAPRHRPLISPTIRNMSYIGLFPMASHFESFTKNCPRLNRLYVQLVPRNEILQNASKMAQVEAEDLWMERNSCYALLMRELFNAPPVKNYKYLEVFESGDAADKDAWDMAVEYVKRAALGWKVAGDGVFVRDKKDLAPEPISGAEPGEPSTLSVNSAP